jgi:predicted GNAT family N-acyltransferase
MLTTLNFRVATGRQIEAAIQARAATFLKDFGHIGDDGNDGIGQQLVAIDQTGAVVAGFRLLGPEARPFPFESVLDLSDSVAHGARPALLGRLFVRHDFRVIDRSTYLLAGLFDLAREFAVTNEISEFYISAFHHLKRLYARAGFCDLGIAIEDRHWRTLHLMRMPVIRN